MKVIIQRVSIASVKVNQETVGEIQSGLLILLGIGHNDSEKEIDLLIKKIINLRIFSDKNGKMNLSLLDIKGELLVVSQFTLYAKTNKGNRPSFIKAASVAKAEKLYNTFIRKCRQTGIRTESGIFGAIMQIHLINDGPVTITISV